MNYKNGVTAMGNTLSFIPPELKEFMHEVPTSKICGWTNAGEWFYPNSIDAQCGHCQEWVNFVGYGNPVQQADTESWIVAMKCVRCGRLSKTFVDGIQRGQRICKEVWMLPAPKTRTPKVNKDLVDADIYDAYETAIDSFNKGSWRSVVTESGRMLEGITKIAFPKKKQRKMLGEITKNQNNSIKQKEDESDEEFATRKLEEETKSILFKPLLELGSAVRLGRLTGAHFKIKGITTKEIAEQVLDLAEYELIYFCKLGTDVKSLKEQIEEITEEEEGED